jgi:cytoskeletal protein RodZ
MESDIVVTDEPQGKIQMLMANRMMVIIMIVIFASIIVGILVVALFIFNKYKTKPKSTKSRKKSEPQQETQKESEECEHQKQKKQEDNDVKKLDELLNENKADQKRAEEYEEKINLKDKIVVIDEELEVESSTDYQIDSSSSIDLSG